MHLYNSKWLDLKWNIPYAEYYNPLITGFLVSTYRPMNLWTQWFSASELFLQIKQ